MEKEAPSNYNIHPLIKKRWSPRAFSSSPVDNEILLRLFEAARWAPSGSNQQPWRFIVGFRGDDTYERIMDTLVEFNQLWAQHAPVLILSLGRKVMNDKDKINPSYNYDVGQAVSQLSLQATAENLFVHQMGGFDAKQAVQLFNIPAQYKPETVIAIGYPGDYKILHENLQKLELAERKRFSLDDLVFSGKFGQKAGFLSHADES